MRCFQPIAAYIEISEMPTQDGKRVKILPKSLLEGTRCLVKIFEGFRAFGQMSEWCFSGDFGRSVQYVLAFLDRCICHAGKSSECPTNGAKIQLSRIKMHGSLLQNAWKMSRNIVQTTKKEYFCTIIAPRFLSSLGV